jgi:hypothetical protein
MALQVNWAKLIAGLDLSEAFKTKGDLRRWSAKRTVGGLLAMTAAQEIGANGVSWEAVALAAVAVLPLCISVAER